MKRIMAVIITVAVMLSLCPVKTATADEKKSSALGVHETLRFDFGGAGAAEGYIDVSAEDAYDAEVGYGFANTDAVENVSASGTSSGYICSKSLSAITPVKTITFLSPKCVLMLSAVASTASLRGNMKLRA